MSREYEYMTKLVTFMMPGDDQKQEPEMKLLYPGEYWGHEEDLSRLGEQGWEILQLIPLDSNFICVFKRGKNSY